MYINIESIEQTRNADTGEWEETHREAHDKIFLAKVGWSERSGMVDYNFL